MKDSLAINRTETETQPHHSRSQSYPPRSNQRRHISRDRLTSIIDLESACQWVDVTPVIVSPVLEKVFWSLITKAVIAGHEIEKRNFLGRRVGARRGSWKRYETLEFLMLFVSVQSQVSSMFKKGSWREVSSLFKTGGRDHGAGVTT